MGRWLCLLVVVVVANWLNPEAVFEYGLGQEQLEGPRPVSGNVFLMLLWVSARAFRNALVQSVMQVAGPACGGQYVATTTDRHAIIHCEFGVLGAPSAALSYGCFRRQARPSGCAPELLA